MLAASRPTTEAVGGMYLQPSKPTESVKHGLPAEPRLSER